MRAVYAMNSRLVTGSSPGRAGNMTLSRLVTLSLRPNTSQVPSGPSAASAASSAGPGPARNVAPGLLAERDRRLGGRQVTPPHPVRVRLDLVVGAPAEHRPGVVLRVPAGHRVLVVLVQQQPLVLVLAGAPAAHQDQPATQFLP